LPSTVRVRVIRTACWARFRSFELTWNGTTPLTLPDGSTRTFLEDGDDVTITATTPPPARTDNASAAARSADASR
jgi:hypothetical protein